MRQGEIYYAHLDPTRGSEQRGMRPVVIVSGNAMNANLSVCVVCPLTTKIKPYAGCLVVEKDMGNGLKADSQVMTIHIRSIAKDRLRRLVGMLEPRQMETIRTHISEILRY